MRTLHDRETQARTKDRVSSLRPDATRRWGKMSADQMLHHVNTALEAAMGRVPVGPLNFPIPKPLLKFIVLRMPWPKSSPTAPEFVAGGRYDFSAEQRKCLQLIDELAARPIEGAWPAHQAFGNVTGHDYSALHAKHLDHHLTQFSA